MERFSLEVKVGLMVVITGVLVAAFLLILGEWNPLTNTYRVTVTLRYAGGIKPGADVHLAGAKVGKVDDIKYLPVKKDDPEAPVIGLVLLIDKNAQKLITEDSVFAVQMESLLGGKMVEITPGPPGKKALADGAVVRGLDPPQLEALINEGVALLEGISAVMDSLSEEDKEKMRELLKTLTRFEAKDVDNVKRIIKNTADLTENINVLSKAIEPELRPLMDDVKYAVGQIEPMMAEARGLLRKVDRTVTELSLMAPSDPLLARAKIEEMLCLAEDLSDIIDRLDRFTARMEDELSDMDREELERMLRQFFQQEGITISVKKVLTKPEYPPPPGAESGDVKWE